MSACLLLGFHCLLRTGELLALTPADFLLGTSSGKFVHLSLLSLAREIAASEAISITDVVTLETLRTVLAAKRQLGVSALPLWVLFRCCFPKALLMQSARCSTSSAHGFRPYSLRRGGATELFQRTQSMEAALIRGRWESSRVARVYISDGFKLPSPAWCFHLGLKPC